MGKGSKRRVYCSGPLFCTEEVREMADIAGVLEKAGYETFLPHRDGLEAFMMKSGKDLLTRLLMLTPVARWVNRAAFALDIFQVIEGCDYFVFNMNGRVPDEGGVVETAVAFGSGKPLVIYKSDHRSLAGGFDDPTISGAVLALSTVDEIGLIPGELEKAAVAVALRGENPYTPESAPPFVRDALELGRTVWRFRRLLDILKPGNGLIR